jgi:hypothetical protein
LWSVARGHDGGSSTISSALDPRGGAPKPQPGGPVPGDALDAIAGKLDRILERLQKLEQDVASLRARKGSD